MNTHLLSFIVRVILTGKPSPNMMSYILVIILILHFLGLFIFVLYSRSNLQRFKADTYFQYIDIKSERIVYDKYLMNGTQPFFYDRGDTALLLFHGFGGSPYEFKPMASYICEKDITVYAPLLPKHGSTINDLAQMRWKEIYTEAKKSLYILKRFYKKVYVGGLCNGGLLSLLLASNEEFDGIIAMSTPVYLTSIWLEKLPLKTMIKMLGWLTPYLRKVKYGAVKDKNVLKSMPVFEGAPVKEVLEVYDLKEEVKRNLYKVKIPVLIIQSRFDNRSAPQSAEFICQNVSSTNKKIVYLENSGHIITLDYDQKLVFQEVFNFISQTSH